MSGAPAQILAALPSSVVVVAPDLSIFYVNHAAESMFAFSSAQVVGKPLSSFPAFNEKFRLLISRVFASKEELTFFDYELDLPPVSSVVVTLHLTPLMNASGDVAQVMLTLEKSSGMKKMAAGAAKKEASRAAGVMAAMLAHEVKNPLSGIRGAAQLLRDEVGQEQQALTELICSEVERISDLLGQVEVFSGESVQPLGPVNIHEVLQYVMSVAAAGFAAHVQFIEKYDPSLPDVLGHRDMLVQLVLNLVKNAAEAMQGQKDASIKLSTSYRSGYRLQQNPLPICVSVEGNGPGIPESVRGHVFEPLISSKEQGRGLGLAVVSKLAADLGAIVELDEEKQPGTRFILMLPVAN